MVSQSIPPFVAILFWDVDPESVRLDSHQDYVFERVMARGGWAAMKWLRTTYAREALASFIQRKGQWRLAPRELAYWCVVTGLDIPSTPGGGRPKWAGP